MVLPSLDRLSYINPLFAITMQPVQSIPFFIFWKTRLFIKHHDTACRNETGTKNGLQAYRFLQKQE